MQDIDSQKCHVERERLHLRIKELEQEKYFHFQTMKAEKVKGVFCTVM